MKKLLLVLFSAVLLLSCSADEMSREGNNSVTIPEVYHGYWKEVANNGVEMRVEEQKFIIKISETRTDTITNWHSVYNQVGVMLTVHLNQDSSNLINIRFLHSINDIEVDYRIGNEIICFATMERQ